MYVVTLAACALCQINPPEAIIAALKDVGLVAGGALTGLLARTSSDDPRTPQRTEIVNDSSDPVPVTSKTSEQNV